VVALFFADQPDPGEAESAQHTGVLGFQGGNKALSKRKNKQGRALRAQKNRKSRPRARANMPERIRKKKTERRERDGSERAVC